MTERLKPIEEKYAMRCPHCDYGFKTIPTTSTCQWCRGIFKRATMKLPPLKVLK